MEAKNTVVIFGTEAFARGEMVNLALSTGAGAGAHHRQLQPPGLLPDPGAALLGL